MKISAAISGMMLVGLCGTVVACGPQGEQISFRSAQERACYDQARAALPQGRELRRDSAGRFVEVTLVDSSIRDIDPSETFNNCMVTEVDPGSISDLGTVNFTGEELEIWNNLNDDAKRNALEFIRNGGTLREFVAI